MILKGKEQGVLAAVKKTKKQKQNSVVEAKVC